MITLHTFFRPYIEQTELWVSSSGGEGEGAELSCLVHALPPAHLAWYRADTLLASQEFNSTHNNMYRLTFKPEQDTLGKVCV